MSSNDLDTTRDRIVEAAGEIFAERGFEATTVRDICHAAGANIAAVNYYFGDKQRLFVEAVLRAHRWRMAQAVLPDWSADTPPKKKLSDFIASLNELTQLLGFELDDQSKSLLNQGLVLANQVDSAQNEADGLRVLIAVWRLLDVKERKAQFDTVSPKLYDFLKNASENQLKCLEGEACGLDIYTIVARNSQIRPQILAYGVDKLKAQINAGGVAFATKALIAKVTRYVASANATSNCDRRRSLDAIP